MKNFTLTALAAIGLTASLQMASQADSGQQSTFSSTHKAAVNRSTANLWPQHNLENGDEPIAGSYTHRLNQLILDDNVRSLRQSVHSNFARNTPSFKRVENLVARLSDRNSLEKDRWEAAQALAECKPRVTVLLAVPSLLQAMNGDPDLTVRNYAALSLSKIDLRSAATPLLLGLESPDSDTRQLCASALHTASAAAVPELVKLVRCPDPYMKRIGCLGLAEIGAPAAHALAALREASSNSDVGHIFGDVAQNSIKKIESEWQAKHASAQDMAFDADLWKSDENGVFRRAMLGSVMSDQFLLGRTAEQLRNLLGEGLSFDKGRELRYAVGAAETTSSLHGKKHVQSTAQSIEGKDMWLVLALEQNVVKGYEMKSFSRTDWNFGRQDTLMEAMIKTEPRL